MIRLLKSIHLYGTYKGVCTFLINHVFTSMKPFSSNIKCAILRSVGHRIGKGTTIVSPVYIIGKVEIGDACWINRGFTVQGDGLVRIGDNCDIAPDVSFLTGGHQIGTSKRRAGTGEVYTITVGNGCWIGARSTLLGNIVVNDGSKSWLHVMYDVFHTHGMPLTAAVVGENIELANDTDTTPGGRTVKQTLDAIVADGGEVMTYLNAQALLSTDPYELWYDYAVRNGKHMIEAYGYRVRGLILSAQSSRNSAVGQEICERFFDYADRVGTKPQYDIHRTQFSDTATVADVKAFIRRSAPTAPFLMNSAQTVF